MFKLNSGRQVFSLFIVLSVLLIVTSGFLFYSLGQSHENTDLLAAETNKLDILSDIRGTDGYIQIAVLRFIIATDPAEMDLQADTVHNYYNQNGDLFVAIENTLDSDVERQLFNQAAQARVNYSNAFEQLLLMRSASTQDRLAFNLTFVRPAFDNLTGKLESFSTEINRFIQNQQTEVHNQITLFQNAGIGLIALAVIVIILLALMTFRIINRLRLEKVSLETESAWRQRAIADLESSNKELESFAYSVSHDLRTPLRSLEGFSQAVVEDYHDKLDEDGKRYLKRIQDAAVLMGKLIDDLLQLSRITRSDMNREKIDLSQMAGLVIDELKKHDPDRKVEVKIQPGLAAQADPRLLRLVLENLIGNAWKFTGKTRSPIIEIGGFQHEGTTAYFVRDNGAGFDMAYADKLFQPFQRLHKSTDFSGTGIGLASVQRIIRRHGGKVWAEGKEGAGAAFYFTLG
jgi:signal transduction histidine kinase